MECVNCGNETGSNSKYCSVACKSKYLRKQHKTTQTNTFEPVDESKHQLKSTNKSPELYTRFDGKRVPLTEAELINEGVDWLKSKVIRKKQSSQPDESVRQLTVTELAEQRARQLNGEVTQFESYTPSSEAQSQPSEQIASRPQFNLGEAIRSVVSKVFPQKKQPEFPQRPVNIYGQPMANWKCYSCWDWVPDSQIALHQVDGHVVEHIL